MSSPWHDARDDDLSHLDSSFFLPEGILDDYDDEVMDNSVIRSDELPTVTTPAVLRNPWENQKNTSEPEDGDVFHDSFFAHTTTRPPPGLFTVENTALPVPVVSSLDVNAKLFQFPVSSSAVPSSPKKSAQRSGNAVKASPKSILDKGTTTLPRSRRRGKRETRRRTLSQDEDSLVTPPPSVAEESRRTKKNPRSTRESSRERTDDHVPARNRGSRRSRHKKEQLMEVPLSSSHVQIAPQASEAISREAPVETAMQVATPTAHPSKDSPPINPAPPSEPAVPVVTAAGVDLRPNTTVLERNVDAAVTIDSSHAATGNSTHSAKDLGLKSSANEGFVIASDDELFTSIDRRDPMERSDDDFQTDEDDEDDQSASSSTSSIQREAVVESEISLLPPLVPKQLYGQSGGASSTLMSTDIPHKPTTPISSWFGVSSFLAAIRMLSKCIQPIATWVHPIFPWTNAIKSFLHEAFEILYEIFAPVIRHTVNDVGFMVALSGKAMILLSLALASVISFSVTANREAVPTVVLDSPQPNQDSPGKYYHRRLLGSIAAAYLLMLGLPWVCDVLMAALNLPPYAPHVLSSSALFATCVVDVYRGSLVATLNNNSNGWISKYPDTACAVQRQRSNNSDDYERRGSEWMCHMLEKGLCVLVPINFIYDGFQEENMNILLLPSPIRLIIAYVWALIRDRYICSPIAWISWSIQVLIVYGAYILFDSLEASQASYRGGGRHSSWRSWSLKEVTVDSLLLVIGFASIGVLREMEHERQTSALHCQQDRPPT
jgi:hypothetical protein